MTKGKMDKKKVAKYQDILVELKEKIVTDIKQIADHDSPSERSDSGDVSGHVMHLADVATDMYDREFSLGLASNNRGLLEKIEKALITAYKKIIDPDNSPQRLAVFAGWCDLLCQKSRRKLGRRTVGTESLFHLPVGWEIHFLSG